MSEERVPDWPRLLATVNVDGTGTLRVHGTDREWVAGSVEALRTGIVARAVQVAVQLRRPVQLHVTESGTVWPLAVHPNGVVQVLNPGLTVTVDDALPPAEGPCRRCGHRVSVVEHRCAQCGVEGPHVVERISQPTPPIQAPPVPVELPAPPPIVTPGLRFRFTTQPAVRAAGRAVLGRRPVAPVGSTGVLVVSPERMVSRTHLLVDVDSAGHLTVTDQHSGNGTQLLTTPPVRLPAGVPFEIPSGSTVQLGDVACTIDVEFL
jgi:hypothetical protein